MSSGIFKLIQIDDAGAVFSRHDFIPGENSFEIGNFQKINPLEEIKVGKGLIDEFWFFYNNAPRIGMLLNGLFSPSRSPSPFLDFFSPIPRPQEVACSQFPTIGGGR